MAIKVGDALPGDVKLKEMTDGGPKDVSLKELTAGKRVVLFAVPGAFTPTCSAKHLPGFVREEAALRAKGIDEIVVRGEERQARAPDEAGEAGIIGRRQPGFGRNASDIGRDERGDAPIGEGHRQHHQKRADEGAAYRPVGEQIDDLELFDPDGFGDALFDK